MTETQIKQVASLKRQLSLPGDKGKHATVCLAQLAKPGNSLVEHEALEALLDTLHTSASSPAKRRAAWALGGLAGAVSTNNLSERIIPTLIEALELDNPHQPDVNVSGQAYQSLLFVGTPDAIAAAAAYRLKVKRWKQETR